MTDNLIYVPPNIANQIVPRKGKVREDLIQRIGTHWRNVGTMLGLEPEVLNTIDDDHRSSYEKTAAVLCRIEQLAKKGLCVREFANALAATNLRNVGEQLVQDLENVAIDNKSENFQ